MTSKKRKFAEKSRMGVDLAGLSNALTDIVVRVTHEDGAELAALRKEGFMGSLTKHPVFHKIINGRPCEYHQGGSPANTLRSAAALGLSTALFGTVGNDALGRRFEHALVRRDVNSLLEHAIGPSGRCYVLVTPDGEKTHTCEIGVSGKYDFKLDRLRSARVFHTSGYELVSNSVRTVETIAYARDLGALCSYDLADARAVQHRRGVVLEVLALTDVLFATEEEAFALTGLAPQKALRELSTLVPIVVLKRGAQGSVVRYGDREWAIPAVPVKVVNTNGAGDAYAAGFLTGLLRGLAPELCGSLGSAVASRVVGSAQSSYCAPPPEKGETARRETQRGVRKESQ